ncbi:MAG: hydroxymethylbilane synthase [Actinomycetota bacterium]|nr:hydroxymethylbilane synthase [Actinomycetota bacterium]
MPAISGRPLRLATRGSAQATTQAQLAADALMAAHPGLRVELVFVETLGDQRTDVPLHTLGGQGVFVKEVQHAVLRGDADLAAHSAKDLPSVVADGLQLAAFTERRDARDALVGARLADLAHGATLATGSVRRRAQLACVRPDLQFVELRGNIITRLTKVPEGGALVMAVAALQILGLTDRIAEELALDAFVPSPGQGCVALECRADDAATADLLAAIDHLATRAAVSLERAFLAELGTGCSLPVAAHAVGDRLTGFLAADSANLHVTKSTGSGPGPAPGPRTITRTVAVSGSSAERLAQAAALARTLRAELGA